MRIKQDESPLAGGLKKRDKGEGRRKERGGGNKVSKESGLLFFCFVWMYCISREGLYNYQARYVLYKHAFIMVCCMLSNSARLRKRRQERLPLIFSLPSSSPRTKPKRQASCHP